MIGIVLGMVGLVMPLMKSMVMISGNISKDDSHVQYMFMKMR